MRLITISQTSERRFIAKFVGTGIEAKGTSEQFAVGRLLRDHGVDLGFSVLTEKELWDWALHHPDARCAVPIDEF